MPPSLREVAFAEQMTEGVSLLRRDTPPVTAYAVPAPSEKGPRDAARKGERYTMKATGIVRRVEGYGIIGQKFSKPA